MPEKTSHAGRVPPQSAAVLSLCILLAPAVLGDCKCHQPDKDDTERRGANIFVVQDEKKPYRQLKGRIVDASERPFEDVLVEVLDQPDYLLGDVTAQPANQKRLAVCVTAKNGKFCFRHVPPGKYELRATKDSGWNISHVYVVVDKTAGQTKNLQVRLSLGI